MGSSEYGIYEPDLNVPSMGTHFGTAAPPVSYVEPALELVPHAPVTDPSYDGFMANMILTDRKHRARGLSVAAKIEGAAHGFEATVSKLAKAMAGEGGFRVNGGEVGGAIRRGLGGALVAEAVMNGTPDLPKILRMVNAPRYAPGASAVGSGPKPPSPFN